MAFRVNVSVFENPQIQDALSTLQEVGSRRKLGIERWDNVLDMYPFSGTVVLPVKIAGRVFREPFYFVVEKVNNHESLRIKPVKGDQWSIGDVYGFFGLYDFGDFTFDMPILVVEGISDWAVCKKYYKYVVSSLSAWVGYRQAFFLSNISSSIFLGYDNDETGSENRKRNAKLLTKLGCSVMHQIPPQGDWGKLVESDFGRMLLDKSMGNFIEKVNKINSVIF